MRIAINYIPHHTPIAYGAKNIKQKVVDIETVKELNEELQSIRRIHGIYSVIKYFEIPYPCESCHG